MARIVDNDVNTVTISLEEIDSAWFDGRRLIKITQAEALQLKSLLLKFT
jgi:hypothetical protein